MAGSRGLICAGLQRRRMPNNGLASASSCDRGPWQETLLLTELREHFLSGKAQGRVVVIDQRLHGRRGECVGADGDPGQHLQSLELKTLASARRAPGAGDDLRQGRDRLPIPALPHLLQRLQRRGLHLFLPVLQALRGSGDAQRAAFHFDLGENCQSHDAHFGLGMVHRQLHDIADHFGAHAPRARCAQRCEADTPHRRVRVHESCHRGAGTAVIPALGEALQGICSGEPDFRVSLRAFEHHLEARDGLRVTLRRARLQRAQRRDTHLRVLLLQADALQEHQDVHVPDPLAGERGHQVAQPLDSGHAHRGGARRLAVAVPEQGGEDRDPRVVPSLRLAPDLCDDPLFRLRRLHLLLHQQVACKLRVRGVGQQAPREPAALVGRDIGAAQRTQLLSLESASEAQGVELVAASREAVRRRRRERPDAHGADVVRGGLARVVVDDRSHDERDGGVVPRPWPIPARALGAHGLLGGEDTAIPADASGRRTIQPSWK
mmetsp:Transcript_47526/g.136602  ORF Transcript_47526/g.136602 Transcript_47526/m.136602 type:complete len:492 (-) Transcript_47526:9-1484(-)